MVDANILTDTKKNLEVISDQLYKGDIDVGMANMLTVIPNLSIICASMNEEQQADFIENVLKPALQSMEDRDGTMLADIISYEMMDVLNQL
ncbi:MAG: hypothetical protein IKL53_01410 [Lachnospiraceae bacterium]|nr:hypothetical protein [Lachnospiraceae bacterium]